MNYQISNPIQGKNKTKNNTIKNVGIKSKTGNINSATNIHISHQRNQYL